MLKHDYFLFYKFKRLYIFLSGLLRTKLVKIHFGFFFCETIYNDKKSKYALSLLVLFVSGFKWKQQKKEEKLPIIFRWIHKRGGHKRNRIQMTAFYLSECDLFVSRFSSPSLQLWRFGLLTERGKYWFFAWMIFVSDRKPSLIAFHLLRRLSRRVFKSFSYQNNS